jgi:two-component system response regulator YesN
MVSVVVVEDEKVIRNGLVLTIPWLELGCKILGEAENGVEGSTLIAKLKPDIVITDVIMPGMNGIDMIRSLQGKTESEYVILSGYADFEFAQTAIELGVKRYLVKPLEESKLKETITDLVREVEEKKKNMHQRDVYKQNLDHDLFFKEYISRHNSDYREKYLEETLRLIADHYAENLTAADVSEYLEISESSFVKMFKNKTGYTFLKYLTLYRIKNSIKLLGDKSLRVCDVAYKVGYSDCRYFGEVFKKYLGMTPLEYRRGRY